jgi:cysteine desulfurase
VVLYLDTAATTPVRPEVAELVLFHLREEFGNSGSRTHDWGSRAKKAVQAAREQVAYVARCKPDEVIFTSGATEADNLAILGLAPYGRETGHKHIISCATEHKAVLEPLEHLAGHGFDVDLVKPRANGIVEVDDVMQRVRPDTLLVSMMLVNNETGVIQQVDSLGQHLRDTSTLLHVDAVQGFAKPTGQSLEYADLVSISAHKIAGPKGAGALITRRRGWKGVPLSPLMYGGGQERKLRPGTVSVPLVAGLGLASELMNADADTWAQSALAFRESLIEALSVVPYEINGDGDRSVAHILNVAFDGIDSEALIVALQGVAAIATGSACTSSSYTPSHVLKAMDLSNERVESSVRFSWWSDTDPTELSEISSVLRGLAA